MVVGAYIALGMGIGVTALLPALLDTWRKRRNRRKREEEARRVAIVNA
jgi:hypothetical protein